jgi:hypothetical protein
MSNEREIQHITTQLQGLNLQQAALLSRLEFLSEAGEQDTASTPQKAAPPPQKATAAREFAIGDRVQIINPRRLQETRGVISRIGARITVTTPKGKTIVRASKNLIFEK